MANNLINITFDMFFDRAGVIAKVKDGTSSTLSKIGAYVRRRARSRIRQGKSSAKPGNPPKSHVGTLRDLIFFGYDDDTNSVVIGPTLFRKQEPTCPNLLEFGGQINKGGKTRFYHEFPFMAPSLEEVENELIGEFEGCVRGD